MTRAMQTLQDATRALREGVASEQQWALVLCRVETAKHLVNQGVLPGIKGHVESADQALHAIQTRARLVNGWHPTPLDLHELDAVQTFTELHAIQMRQVRATAYGGRRLVPHRRAMRGATA